MNSKKILTKGHGFVSNPNKKKFNTLKEKIYYGGSDSGSSSMLYPGLFVHSDWTPMVPERLDLGSLTLININPQAGIKYEPQFKINDPTNPDTYGFIVSNYAVNDVVANRLITLIPKTLFQDDESSPIKWITYDGFTVSGALQQDVYETFNRNVKEFEPPSSETPEEPMSQNMNFLGSMQQSNRPLPRRSLSSRTISNGLELFIPVSAETRAIPGIDIPRDRTRYRKYTALFYPGIYDDHTKLSLILAKLIGNANDSKPTPENVKFQYNDNELRNELFHPMEERVNVKNEDAQNSKLSPKDTHPEILYTFIVMAYGMADNILDKSADRGISIGCRIDLKSPTTDKRTLAIQRVIQDLASTPGYIEDGILSILSNVATFSSQNSYSETKHNLNFYYNKDQLIDITHINYKPFAEIYFWLRGERNNSPNLGDRDALSNDDMSCIQDATKHLINWDKFYEDAGVYYADIASTFGTMRNADPSYDTTDGLLSLIDVNELIRIFEKNFYSPSESTKVNRINEHIINKFNTALKHEIEQSTSKAYEMYGNLPYFYTFIKGIIKEACLQWYKTSELFNLAKKKHLLKSLAKRLLAQALYTKNESARLATSWWDDNIANSFDISNIELDRDEHDRLFYRNENGDIVFITPESIWEELTKIKNTEFKDTDDECYGVALDPQDVNGTQLNCTQFILSCLIEDRDDDKSGHHWSVCKKFLTTPGFWNKLSKSIDSLTWTWILAILVGLKWNVKYKKIEINGKLEKILIVVSYEEWLKALKEKKVITDDEQHKIANNDKFRGFVQQLIAKVNGNPVVLNKNLTLKKFDVSHSGVRSSTAEILGIPKYEPPFSRMLQGINPIRIGSTIRNQVLSAINRDFDMYGSFVPKIKTQPNGVIKFLRGTPMIVGSSKYGGYASSELSYLDYMRELDKAQAFRSDSNLKLTSTAPFLKVSFEILIKQLLGKGIQLHPSDVQKFNKTLSELHRNEKQINDAIELIRMFTEHVEMTGFRRLDPEVTLKKMQDLVKEHAKGLDNVIKLRIDSIGNIQIITDKLAKAEIAENTHDEMRTIDFGKII